MKYLLFSTNNNVDYIPDYNLNTQFHNTSNKTPLF